MIHPSLNVITLTVAFLGHSLQGMAKIVPSEEACFAMGFHDGEENIWNKNSSNKIMLSFIVNSIFANVPIDSTITFFEQYLNNNTFELPFSADTLINLIALCVE